MHPLADIPIVIIIIYYCIVLLPYACLTLYAIKWVIPLKKLTALVVLICRQCQQNSPPHLDTIWTAGRTYLGHAKYNPQTTNRDTHMATRTPRFALKNREYIEFREPTVWYL